MTDPSGLDRTTTISYTPDDQQASRHRSRPGRRDADRRRTPTTRPATCCPSRSTDPGAGGPAAWFGADPVVRHDACPTQVSGGQPATATRVTWTGSGGASSPAPPGSQVATAGPVVDTTGSFTVAGLGEPGRRGHRRQPGGRVAGRRDRPAGSPSVRRDHRRLAVRPAADRHRQPVASPSAESSAAGDDRHLDVPDRHLQRQHRRDDPVRQRRRGRAPPPTPPRSPPTGRSPSAAPRPAGRRATGSTGRPRDVQVYPPRPVGRASVSRCTGRAGRRTSPPAQLTTTWTRDERGLPTSMTDPDGSGHQLLLRRGRPARGDHRSRR